MNPTNPNRKSLIPSISTSDLDPKEPWNPDEEKKTEVTVAPKKERSLLVKAILAFIIVGAIVGIGILLPLKLIPNASSLIATAFNANDDEKNEEVEPAAEEPVAFRTDNSRIRSGDNVVVSWSGPVRREGEYALQYPCAEGIEVTLIAADGSKPAIACGEPFRFISMDNTMTLSIASRFQRLSEIPLTFSFADASGPRKLADVRVTLVNNMPENPSLAGATTTPSTGASGGLTDGGQVIVANNNNTTSGGTAPRPSASAGSDTAPRPAGRPDLSVKVVSVGTIDKNTNAFTPATSVESGERAAVVFAVTNNGGAWSGTWSFNALLPTADSKLYMSGPLASLAPGSSILFTLGFDNMKDAQENSVIIAADPQFAVAESDESNNLASAVFRNRNAGGSTNVSGRYPDLKVEILGVGRMNGSTFVKDSEIDSNDRAAVQFRVTNIGQEISSRWEYEVTMEQGNDERTYESGAQQALLGGQSTVLTVAFDDIEDGELDFEVVADPNRYIMDTNRSNNRDTASLDVDN